MYLQKHPLKTIDTKQVIKNKQKHATVTNERKKKSIITKGTVHMNMKDG